MPISSSLHGACGVHLSSQATEVLKKQQINIRDARISTEEASPRATHVYIVEDRGGGGLSDQRLAEAWGSSLEGASNTPHSRIVLTCSHPHAVSLPRLLLLLAGPGSSTTAGIRLGCCKVTSSNLSYWGHIGFRV